MATLSITIPDSEVTRVQTALCESQGMAVSAANAKAVVVSLIKGVVFARERAATQASAQATYDAAVSAQPVDPGLS